MKNGGNRVRVNSTSIAVVFIEIYSVLQHVIFQHIMVSQYFFYDGAFNNMN